MDRKVEEAWLSAFFGSNAVFSILLLTLLVVYFGSERSVLHVRCDFAELSLRDIEFC